MLLHPELTGVRGIFQFCIPTAPWVHRNQNSICEDRDLRDKGSSAPRNKPFSIRINADVQWRRWPLLDQPRPALRVWIAAPQVGIRLLPRSRLLVHGCHCHLVSTRSLPLPLLPALCISPSCGGQGLRRRICTHGYEKVSLWLVPGWWEPWTGHPTRKP